MSENQDAAAPTPDIKTSATKPVEEETENGGNDPDSSSKAVTPPPTTVADDGRSQEHAIHEAAMADADSEAETLIESPEKKKAHPLDNPPIFTAPEQPHIPNGERADKTPGSPSSDGSSRKRKRSDIEKPDSLPNLRSSSPRSSALSSPRLGSESAGGDQSDTGSKRSAFGSKASDSRHMERSSRQSEEPGHNGGDETEATLKARHRKRRQSLGTGTDMSREVESSHHRFKGKGGAVTSGNTSERRETRSATYPRQSSHERSLSPQSTGRNHKRVNSSQSTQPNSTGSTKKRRLPAPLVTGKRNRSEDRLSVSTDISGSPQPSAPQLRKLVSAENDAVSPAKMVGQHRKHRDQNGRTWLARACANDELDQAKAYYEERPTDLNLADNAGNTPLQIASLSGFTNIVQFLLSKGCDIDTKNIDADTPLIDAVENCHVDVVRLLLDGGANPRLGNGKGDEPYELVPEDGDDYDEIRTLISNAKNKKARRRQSDDQTLNTKEGSSRAASAASPRDSPPVVGPKSPPASSLMSRRRTGRSESTRNDLLWQHHTQSNLMKLAGMGDLQAVVSVLNSLQKAEPVSVIAAARAGHDEVLSFLLGMGNPDPDPDPLMSPDHRRGHNTPMLAAIGRGNNKVIKLLLQQDGFNPRRRFDGQSYPEISMKRKGEAWEEEYKLLKDAYDNSRSPKSRKQSSPKKIRDPERQHHHSRDSASPSASLRKQPRSPTTGHRERPLKQPLKRDPSGRKTLAPDAQSPTLKRASSGDHSVAVISDHDLKASSSLLKQNKTRRSHSDIPAPSSEGEGQKKRRLLSRKDHRELHSKRYDSTSEEEKASSKVKSDPLSKTPLKRPRSSLTPDRPRSRDSGVTREERKKRRIVGSSESPELSKAQLPRKKSKSGEGEGSSELGKQGREAKLLRDVDGIFKRDQQRRDDQVPPSRSAKFTASSSEDKEMENVKTEADDGDQQRRLAEIAAAEAEATAKATAEETRAKTEADARAKAEADAEAERQHKSQQEKQEAERLVREEDERRRQAEAEAEAQRIKAEEERRRLEEEEAARKRAEEEAAQRHKEEEERRERLRREEEERQERLKREREERQRLLEERRQREAEEKERARREALPPLLGKHTELVDRNDPIARDPVWLRASFPVRTAELGQIDPSCSPDYASEKYMINFQAAILLATKDFNLTQYTQLERKPATPLHRQLLFNTFKSVLWINFVGAGPFLKPFEANQRERAGLPKFMALEPLFWVRVCIEINTNMFSLPVFFPFSIDLLSNNH